MAGIFICSVAGLGFLVIAAIEALIPFRSPLTLTLTLTPNLPFIRYLSISLLSSLFILYSLLASLSSSVDPIAPFLPIPAAVAAGSFLLYSLSGLLLPYHLSPILPVLSLYAFFQEVFFFFYDRRKDLDGVENRYFDILLVPVLVCLVSTLVSLARPRWAVPRVTRAAGLALHGTWVIQMAFFFFSSAIAHGCFLHRRSWANYTVRCKGHPEYHGALAIATLRLSCHLTLLIVVAVWVYSSAVSLGEARRGWERYRAVNTELQRMGGGRFSLQVEEEEEEEDDEEQEIKSGEVVMLVADIRNSFEGAH